SGRSSSSSVGSGSERKERFRKCGSSSSNRRRRPRPAPSYSLSYNAGSPHQESKQGQAATTARQSRSSAHRLPSTPPTHASALRTTTAKPVDQPGTTQPNFAR